MRTNQYMRQKTRMNIRDFFVSAQNQLTTPDWPTIILPFLEEYKMNPDINWIFYDKIWDRGYIQIIGWDSVSVALPGKTFGRIESLQEDAKAQSDYYLRASIQKEELDEATQLYIKQHTEMGQASKALIEGADEALGELTMERALFRLPEMKRFLPEQYRRG